MASTAVLSGCGTYSDWYSPSYGYGGTNAYYDGDAYGRHDDAWEREAEHRRIAHERERQRGRRDTMARERMERDNAAESNEPRKTEEEIARGLSGILSRK